MREAAHLRRVARCPLSTCPLLSTALRCGSNIPKYLSIPVRYREHIHTLHFVKDIIARLPYAFRSRQCQESKLHLPPTCIPCVLTLSRKSGGDGIWIGRGNVREDSDTALVSIVGKSPQIPGASPALANTGIYYRILNASTQDQRKFADTLQTACTSV